jgi:hypothetical protein
MQLALASDSESMPEEQEKQMNDRIQIVQGDFSLYKPSSPLIPCIALRQTAANSSSGIPIFSHSRMMSRLTERANAFSFIRFIMDLG